MKQSLCTITSNVELSPRVWLMWLEAPDIAIAAQPGQFVMVRCEDFVLRRPFSIHQVVIGGNVIAVSRSPEPFASCHSERSEESRGAQDKRSQGEAKQSQIAILFQVLGKGTLWLSQRQTGDKIDVLGPLGKGFSIPSVIVKGPEYKRRNLPRQSKNLLLVAGGIGIAPLTFLAQRASPQHSVALIHGASTAAQIYPLSSLRALHSPCHSEPFTVIASEAKQSHPSGQAPLSNLSPLSQEVRFVPVTEDGSAGKKGTVTDVLPDFLDWADQIFACGPVDMYKAMSTKSLRAERSNLKKCQVSLEMRLGCGIGACYSCTINTKRGLKKVCRDGPVFELNDILWEEVKI